MPSSPDIVKDSIHYNQVGFNEVGREVARNTAYRLYPALAPEADVSIKLLGWDGATDLAGKVDTNVLTENQVVVPVVYPLYRSKELVLSGDRRRLFVTLGQFSIIRLERDAQLVVPVLEYSLPTKECCDNPGCAEDPCEMFSRIPFPAAQFSPRGCDRQEGCDCC